MLHFTERGAGPPLLLLHGILVTGRMFDAIADRLASHHRLVIPDLRGHGASRTLGPPYDIPRVTADVIELLDHLGIEATAVLGYSYGGTIAQQIALTAPARCRRLVLTCTYACTSETFRERMGVRVVPWVVRAIGMRAFAKRILLRSLPPSPRREQIIAMIADQDSKAMSAVWPEAMKFDSRRRLGEIRCPTLIVAAAQDGAVPQHHAYRFQQEIAGSRMEMFENADHSLIWAKPEAVLRVVEEFLTPSAG